MSQATPTLLTLIWGLGAVILVEAGSRGWIKPAPDAICIVFWPVTLVLILALLAVYPFAVSALYFAKCIAHQKK
jgi:hypothetical protein